MFGIVPLAFSWTMRRGKSHDGSRVMSSPLVLVLAAIVAGPSRSPAAARCIGRISLPSLDTLRRQPCLAVLNH